jgi:hypothetical protein
VWPSYFGLSLYPLVLPRSIDIHTADEAADHAPSTRSTRVALSNAGRRGLPLGRHSISGPTVRNLSDRVSRSQKRCGAGQGAPVTNHRQHTGCASAAHFFNFTDRPRRRQPGPVHPPVPRPPSPKTRRRNRNEGNHRLSNIVVVVASTPIPSHPIPSISISSVHRQRPSFLCFASIKTSF